MTRAEEDTKLSNHRCVSYMVGTLGFVKNGGGALRPYMGLSINCGSGIHEKEHV